MKVEIIYQDAQLVLAVKPAGVLSEEGGMPELLRAQTGAKEIFCVHRLDRAVGGLMVYAKTKAAAAALSKQIAEGKTDKRYLAVCGGETPDHGELRDLLYHDAAKNKSYVVKRMRRGVREAVLHYETLARHEGRSLVRVELLTGRSHQIRVQFASRGYPLLGDRRYGGEAAESLALWCESLRFTHPKSGETMAFSVQPKGDAWEGFETTAQGRPLPPSR